MGFLSCFRRRQDNSLSPKKSNFSKEEPVGKGHQACKGKIAPRLLSNKPAVKLAPRSTAILHTPKQAVGTRITQANAARRKITLADSLSSDDEMNLTNPSVSPPPQPLPSSLHPIDSIASESTSTLSTTEAKEKSATNEHLDHTNEPLVLSLRTSTFSPPTGPPRNQLLGLNPSQNEELKAVFARRAAQQSQTFPEESIQ